MIYLDLICQIFIGEVKQELSCNPAQKVWPWQTHTKSSTVTGTCLELLQHKYYHGHCNHKNIVRPLIQRGKYLQGFHIDMQCIIHTYRQPSMCARGNVQWSILKRDNLSFPKKKYKILYITHHTSFEYTKFFKFQ